MKILALLILAACSDSLAQPDASTGPPQFPCHSVETVCEAARDAGWSVCARAIRCGESTEDVQTCAVDFVERVCAEQDCEAPYTRWVELATCLDVPCGTAERACI